MPLALLRLGLMPYEIWITAFLALKPKGIIKISVGWVRVAQSKYIWGQRDFAWPIKVFATLPKTPCYKCPARGQKPSSLSLGVKQRTQNHVIVISKKAAICRRKKQWDAAAEALHKWAHGAPDPMNSSHHHKHTKRTISPDPQELLKQPYRLESP